MAVQLTIRGISNEVRDELASRASLKGVSMQEYLKRELERIASSPPVELTLERLRERKSISLTRLDSNEILAARDADRR